MSTVAASRAMRPGIWALVLTLLALTLAPLAVQPPAAGANVCDSLAIGGVCGNDTGVGGVVNDVGGALGDAGSAVAGAVSTAGQWAGDHATGILKAAAAAGIAVGTWAACSKILKVVATAGAAGAAAAGSGGTGTVIGGAAGLAASAAVCKLVQRGGKLVLRVGKGGLKTGGRLAGIAKLAAGATGLAAIVYGVQHAAAWVLNNLLDLDGNSAPNLGAPWLRDLRSALNGTAGVLLIVATILALTFAGASGRISSIGPIVRGTISVALIIGVVGSLLLAALQLSDAVTAGTLHSPWGQQALGNWKDLGDSYAAANPVKDAAGAAADAAKSAAGAAAGTPADDGKGPWVVRLLIAFVMVFCGAFVWLEMVVRDALLYLLLAFAGLLLAGYPFPPLRHIAQRFGMTLLGIVVAKPVIVITLLIGGSFMQNAAAGGADDGVIVPLLQGAGLMALAAFMGWHILSWFSIHGVGAVTSAGARIRGVATSGGGGGSRSPSGRSGGDGDGGGGGGGRGGSSRDRDPAAVMAQDAGSRVGETAGTAGGSRDGAGSGSGSLSGRLQRAMARETSGGGSAAAAAGAGALAATAAASGARATGGAGEREQQSPRGMGTDAASAEAAPSTVGSAAPAEAPSSSGQPNAAPTGSAVGSGPAIDRAADATPNAAAAAGGDPGAAGPTSQRAAAAPPAPLPGAAVPTAASGGPVPGAAPGGPAPTGGTPIGAPGAGAAPPASVPVTSSSTSTSSAGDATTESVSREVFGHDPADPAAAFGEHAAATRDLLAANRAMGRT